MRMMLIMGMLVVDMVMTMVMLMMRMDNFGAPCSAHLQDDGDDHFGDVDVDYGIMMMRMIEFWDYKTNEFDGQKYFVGAYGDENDVERSEKKN